jgi:hypothetical protein
MATDFLQTLIKLSFSHCKFSSNPREIGLAA